MSRTRECEKPLVSVVIPVYNSERTVGSTLRSVMDQTWDRLDIIVVIDGATDGSHEACRRIADARVRFVVQENRGLAGARNSGIGAARGRYIAFIDADDTWRAEKIERHVAQMEKDPDIGLAYSHSSLMNDDGIPVGTRQMEGSNPTTFRDLFVRNVIGNGSNAVLRKAVFDGRSPRADFPALRGFDPELRRAEDYELWSRIALKTRWKFACLPEPLVNYRVHPGSLSADTIAQRQYHFLAMARIAAIRPGLVESLRKTAVAHSYWHQARVLASQGRSREALSAVRLALWYDWRSLNANHAAIGLATATGLLLPRKAYFGAQRVAERAWGRMQRARSESNRRPGEAAPASPAPPARSPTAANPGAPSLVRRKALPNLFILSHRHRFMYLAVAKNASTSMRQLIYRQETGQNDPEVLQSIHRYWGFRPRKGLSVAVGDPVIERNYGGYRRFVVYRDPVSRFLSAYHNRVLFARSDHPFYAGKRLEAMGLDAFIDVAEQALAIDEAQHIDEHLRPQSWFFEPADVDDIVPIGQLDNYLHQAFGIERAPSANRTTLPRIEATPGQLTRIRELYVGDYAIEPNWPRDAVRKGGKTVIAGRPAQTPARFGPAGRRA